MRASMSRPLPRETTPLRWQYGSHDRRLRPWSARDPAVWRGLLAALDRPDTVALSLPGFDSARPAGFGATMEEYADWLAAQLERLGGPVDLVGHDWGGGFVVRVV